MLSFYSTPRMINFEAFIAVACTTVHATFCGFLRWWFTKVTHNGCGCPGCLPVFLDNSFQSKISKETIDSSFSKIYIMLTARARKNSCPRGQWIALPACVISKSLFSSISRKMNRMKKKRMMFWNSIYLQIYSKTIMLKVTPFESICILKCFLENIFCW